VVNRLTPANQRTPPEQQPGATMVKTREIFELKRTAGEKNRYREKRPYISVANASRRIIEPRSRFRMRTAKKVRHVMQLVRYGFKECKPRNGANAIAQKRSA